MKIAIFSPLPPEKTDIANYTMRIVRELKSYHTVELYTDQNNIQVEENDIVINRYHNEHDIDWLKLNQFDHVLYNIGNNALFHEKIWRISQKKSGIVILHDQILHEFFNQVLNKKDSDSREYVENMKFIYGEKGKDDAKKFLNGTKAIDMMCETYPLTELALQNASGVITHTKELHNMIVDKGFLPAINLNLPYPLVNQKINTKEESAKKKLLIFGFINPNRRLDEILEALSNIDQSTWHLDIAGKLWDEKHILNKSDELGIKNNTSIHGFLDDDDLDSAIANADLIFNLRYPSMGEASGSQLRIWSQGSPSIVTNIGWYSELPNDTVIKISKDKEKEEIVNHVEAIVQSHDYYEKVGGNGRDYFISNHNVVDYVKALSDFLSKLDTWKKNRVYYHFLSHIGHKLNDISVNNEEVNLQNITLEVVDNS